MNQFLSFNYGNYLVKEKQTSDIFVQKTSRLGNKVIQNPKQYNCFIGISIRNKFFSKKNMYHYIKWMSVYCNKGIILLMDKPDKYNLMVFKDLDESCAFEKTQHIAEYQKKAYEKIIRTLNVNNIKVIQFKDFEKSTNYLNFSKKIKARIDNKIISTSLWATMESNVGVRLNTYLQSKEVKKEDIYKIKKTLFKYIREEMFAILYFNETGYPIEIDPHEEYETKIKYYQMFKPSIKTGHIDIRILNDNYFPGNNDQR